MSLTPLAFEEPETINAIRYFKMQSTTPPLKNSKQTTAQCTTQWARKIKKVQAKKTREINLTKNFFNQNPFFAISKMAKNQFLNWEKI